MKRTSKLLVSMLATFTAAWSGAALAASCTNGQAIFNKTAPTQLQSCGDSLCHKPNLSANNIVRGAKNPETIDAALTNVPEMTNVRRAHGITSTDLEDLADWIFYASAGQPCPSVTPVPPPTAGTVDLIEYFHAAFGHYFVTYLAGEISKLDDGTFAGWSRTGKQLKAYTASATGLSPVCRFFTVAFPPKSSHFYTPDTPECEGLKPSPVWQYEGEVFFTQQATVAGVCPPNTLPVYRMYNNGQSGAPNHRYTTDFSVREQMLAQGWIPEGAGTLGVIMCAPP